MSKPWFEKYEDILKADLKSLDDLSIKYEIDLEQKSKGVLLLRLIVLKENALNIELNEDLHLEAEFPDSYPVFRPEVFATNLQLPRHQNPVVKNLCLLPRPSQYWDVSKTIGEYLKDQLPKAIAKGNIIDQDEIAQDENEQAEPVSEFYAQFCNFVVAADVPDDETEIPTSKDQQVIDSGTFLFKASEPTANFEFGAPNDERNIMRLMIQEWRDRNGKVIKTTNLSLPSMGNALKVGAWFRLDAIGALDEKAYAKILDATKKVIKKPDPIKFKDGTITYVAGITFPEEVTKGKLSWGWLFVLFGVHNQKLKTRQGIKLIPKNFKLTVAATRIGRKDYMARIPKLQTLAEENISVVGLGSLGAPSAIEFAKNGLQVLKVLDFDKVEPTSSVRWSLGFKYMGLYKAVAIRHFISEHFPHTLVQPIIYRLGIARSMNHSSKSEEEILDELFSNTSLVFDASAEEGVNHLLSRAAKENDVPYISIEARRGAWGGLLFRQSLLIGKACWMCMKYHLNDGEIPLPPQDETGGIQPRGCGDPTFTGASFDLQNISLAGVRLAVSTLCNANGGYGDVDWNLAILEMVDVTGNPIVPRWRTYSLAVHADCPYCNND